MPDWLQQDGVRRKKMREAHTCVPARGVGGKCRGEKCFSFLHGGLYLLWLWRIGGADQSCHSSDVSATVTYSKHCCHDRGGRCQTDAPVLLLRRQQARAEGRFEEADGLKEQLADLGLEDFDKADDSTEFKKAPSALELARQQAVKAEAGKLKQHLGCGDQRGLQHTGHEVRPRMRSRRNKKTNSSHRIRKVRGRAFAEWLVATFAVLGPPVLVHETIQMSAPQGQHRRNLDIALPSAQGQGGRRREVLDVAGGSGDLCWWLVMEHGIATSVVDPRPMRLSEGKTLQALRLVRSTAATRVSSAGSGRGEGDNVGLEALSAEGEEALRSTSGLDVGCLNARAVRRFRINARDQSGRDTEGASGRDGLDAKERDVLVQRTCVILAQRGMAHHACLFQPAERAEEGAALKEAREAWERCDVVVGLHPDEATDAIVDAALAARKPFAVVPCCVFPSAFPHRRLRVAKVRVEEGVGEWRGGAGGRGGKGAEDWREEVEVTVPVRNREELIEYLVQKAPAGLIKRSRVPGEGRDACPVVLRS